MEKGTKEPVNFEKKPGEKQFKKKKSVNWESKILENMDSATKEKEKKPEVKLSSDNDKEYLEIEVINKDGNTTKKRVKYESKESKEFTKKRGEKMHNEYTKAKEFLEKHKNDE